MSRVEIKLDGAGRGSVRVDGKELKGVTRAELVAEVAKSPKVRLDVIVTDGHVELEETETEIRPTVVKRGER